MLLLVSLAIFVGGGITKDSNAGQKQIDVILDKISKSRTYYLATCIALFYI